MNRSTIQFSLIPAAMLFSLALIGCGSSMSNSQDTSGAASNAPDVSAPANGDPSTTEGSTAPEVVATSTPDSGSSPTFTSAPLATLAEPPVSASVPIMTLAPGANIVFPPSITSLTAQTSWTCVQALAAGSRVVVTWTTANAVQVSVVGPGLKQAVKRAANDQLSFPLTCGESTVVRVTPLGTNGVQGTQKTITITVGAPVLIPIQP